MSVKVFYVNMNAKGLYDLFPNKDHSTRILHESFPLKPCRISDCKSSSANHHLQIICLRDFLQCILKQLRGVANHSRFKCIVSRMLGSWSKQADVISEAWVRFCSQFGRPLMPAPPHSKKGHGNPEASLVLALLSMFARACSDPSVRFILPAVILNVLVSASEECVPPLIQTLGAATWMGHLRFVAERRCSGLV
jgi:hypothetical protein